MVLPLAVRQLKVLLQLKGERQELRALARMFPADRAGEGPRVFQLEDRFYVYTPELEQAVAADRAHETADSVVSRLNGLGLLKFAGFRPVRRGNMIHPSPSGYGTRVLVDTAHFQLPSRALTTYVERDPVGPGVADPAAEAMLTALPPVELWTNVLNEHAPHLDDALHLLTVAAESGDWRLLYMAYEIVESQAGQPSRLEKRGWATRDEIRRFKETANSWRVLGKAARHGNPSEPPPKDPITLRNALALVRRIVLGWLAHLADGGGEKTRRTNQG